MGAIGARCAAAGRARPRDHFAPGVLIVWNRRRSTIVQQTMCNVQHITCNRQRATDDKRRAYDSIGWTGDGFVASCCYGCTQHGRFSFGLLQQQHNRITHSHAKQSCAIGHRPCGLRSVPHCGRCAGPLREGTVALVCFRPRVVAQWYVPQCAVVQASGCGRR